MNKVNKTKQLMKIVIGASWVDGVVTTEEREYLTKMLKENNLIDDPEIKSLLSPVKPISLQDCYKWLEDYLGKNHKKEDYQKLLEAISGIFYSDGDIDIEEAKLLHYLQDLNPENEPRNSAFRTLLGSIKKMYSRAIKN